MLTTDILIKIPFDELCDSCKFINYGNDGSSAFCNIFLESLNTNEDEQYIPCKGCFKRRG